MRKMIIIFLCISATGLYAQDLSRIAVVNSSGLRLRGEPDTSSEIIENFESGTKLLVLNESSIPEVIAGYNGNWVKVSTINGLTGWTYDQWLDIYDSDEYYITENSFSTAGSITIAPKKVIIFNSNIYQIAFLIDKQGNASLFIGTYVNREMVDYARIKVAGLKNSNIYTLYDFEEYIDFIVIDDNDFIVSCGLEESLCVFRITDKKVIWSKTFDIGTRNFSPKISVNRANEIFVVNENNRNFKNSNYDITIRKFDIDGNIMKESVLATEKWDNVISVNCIGDYLYLSGDFNGLKNSCVCKLDNNLNIVDSKIINSNSDSYITNVVDDGNDLYLTMIISGTTGNIGRPVMVVSISRDLELNWAKSILGDNYNTEAGLRYSDNKVYILTSTKEKYLYGRDTDDKRFSINIFSSNGDYIAEKHFILPISSIVEDFVYENDELQIWGKTPVYGKDVFGNVIRELAKIYFHAVYDQDQIKNFHLRNTIRNARINLSGQNDIDLYAYNSEVLNTEIEIRNESILFINKYPWNREVIQNAFYYEESDR